LGISTIDYLSMIYSKEIIQNMSCKNYTHTIANSMVNLGHIPTF
jgi:hypothetical protein